MEKIARFQGGEKKRNPCHVSGCRVLLLVPKNGDLDHFGPVWSSTPSGSTAATPSRWFFGPSGCFKEKLKGDNKRAKLSRHFLALFHTFSHIVKVFRIFPPKLSLRLKGFYYCFSSKRPKENKKKKPTIAAKIITKNLFTKIIFGSNEFCNYCKNTLQSAKTN